MQCIRKQPSQDMSQCAITAKQSCPGCTHYASCHKVRGYLSPHMQGCIRLADSTACTAYLCTRPAETDPTARSLHSFLRGTKQSVYGCSAHSSCAFSCVFIGRKACKASLHTSTDAKARQGCVLHKTGFLLLDPSLQSLSDSPRHCQSPCHGQQQQELQ